MKHAPARFKQAIFLITALLLCGCTEFDALNSLVPSRSYTLTSDVRYGQLARQKLDVYRPVHISAPPRIVIFFYGGWWRNGRKEDYRFVAQALTSRGFIAVMPDYRLYPDVTFPAFVEDGALAVKWAHEHAAQIGGDSSRVYLMGHSAGAHIAALLTLDGHYLHDVGLDRSAIRATIGLAGPYDFVPKPEAHGVFGPHPGDDIEPISFVDGHQPPMLLVTGLNDTIVEPENTLHLAARIRERGGAVQLITYPKANHVDVALALAAPFRWKYPVLDDVAKYIRAH
jgi:acetyl esterase/lipase